VPTLLLLTGAGQDGAPERAAFPDVRFVVRAPGEALDGAESAEAIVTHAPVPIPLPPEGFPMCRVVVRAGVGTDLIDAAAWAARGVPVCNVPDYATEDVADHAIALMLALARGLAWFQESVRAGAWDAGAPLLRRLRGAVFGVAGAGRIGRASALRARGFGMRVLAWPGPADWPGEDRAADLPSLLREADVVSLHCPLTPATRGMIGAEALAGAKPGLILVNTARGGLVDLDALEAGLRHGRIGGAGLDVLPQEPPDWTHPLLAAWRNDAAWLRGRLVLSPHAAYASPESAATLHRQAVQTALDWLCHGRLTNCVNRAMLRTA
jgi:D-3-phosphoglycerate dehydrogenase/C-terminal binding protein